MHIRLGGKSTNRPQPGRGGRYNEQKDQVFLIYIFSGCPDRHQPLYQRLKSKYRLTLFDPGVYRRKIEFFKKHLKRCRHRVGDRFFQRQLPRGIRIFPHYFGLFNK